VWEGLQYGRGLGVGLQCGRGFSVGGAFTAAIGVFLALNPLGRAGDLQIPNS
jgi:hypothetical protein